MAKPFLPATRRGRSWVMTVKADGCPQASTSRDWREQSARHSAATALNIANRGFATASLTSVLYQRSPKLPRPRVSQNRRTKTQECYPRCQAWKKARRSQGTKALVDSRTRLFGGLPTTIVQSSRKSRKFQNKAVVDIDLHTAWERSCAGVSGFTMRARYVFPWYAILDTAARNTQQVHPKNLVVCSFVENRCRGSSTMQLKQNKADLAAVVLIIIFSRV